MKSQKNIWGLLALWNIIKHDSIFLYRVLLHPRSWTTVKLAIIGLIVYVLSPIDIIPDRLFILGAIDDLAVIVYIMKFIKKHTPPKVKDEIEWKIIIVDADKQ